MCWHFILMADKHITIFFFFSLEFFFLEQGSNFPKCKISKSHGELKQGLNYPGNLRAWLPSFDLRNFYESEPAFGAAENISWIIVNIKKATVVLAENVSQHV